MRHKDYELIENGIADCKRLFAEQKKDVQVIVEMKKSSFYVIVQDIGNSLILASNVKTNIGNEEMKIISKLIIKKFKAVEIINNIDYTSLSIPKKFNTFTLHKIILSSKF